MLLRIEKSGHPSYEELLPCNTSFIPATKVSLAYNNDEPWGTSWWIDIRSGRVSEVWANGKDTFVGTALN